MHRSLAAASLLFFAAACRQNDDPSSAEELYAEVVSANYHAWQRAPGYEKRRAAGSPHSDEVEIFVNDDVAAALVAAPGASEWPVGSIIVKDGFDTSGEHDLTAIMEKRDDGWFWAEYDGAGKPAYSGVPAICTDCHGSGSDFVRAFQLP